MTQKTAPRPMHTLAFYEMGAAFLVLLAVAGVVFPKAGTGVWISIGSGALNIGHALFAIRTGRAVVPLLSDMTPEERKAECRYMEKAVRICVAITATALIGIAVLLALHRLSGVAAIACIVAFNLYGWFAYAWWREAWGMVAECRELASVNPPVNQEAEAIRAEVTEPSPVRLQARQG